MQGPLFADGTFEYVPIPDDRSIDDRTYGNTLGRHGKPLADYFPPARQRTMAVCSIHYDPEFSTFTYGDPTVPKRSLRTLRNGDLLVFYAGLEGWGFNSSPALYLIGFLNVEIAGIAADFKDDDYIRKHFGENFHVRHKAVYHRQKSRLVLVRGGQGSKLFRKAVMISSVGHDVKGRDLKVLSPEMQRIFGDFRGRTSIQRSPPRWVGSPHVKEAAEYVRSLE
jgi:hypothetical protein